MRYSTTPDRDRLRIALWLTISCLALYLTWAIVPFGLHSSPRISWSPGIKQGDRVALMEALRDQGRFFRRNELKDTYRETFFVPWTRMLYRSSATFRKEGARVSIRVERRAPSYELLGTYHAVRTGEGWELLATQFSHLIVN